MTDFLAEAAALGDRLCDAATFSGPACNWLTRRVPHLTSPPQEPVAALETMGPAVYSGTAGAALALGRLARATGSGRHAAVAQGALEHALAHAWDVDASLLGKVGSEWRYGYHGGALGIACVAAELSDLLGDRYQRAAEEILQRLAKSEGPREMDVIFGHAGAIPPLLRLGEEGLARRLGDELLAWKPTLTGMSHGASGGAWALARLAAATGEARYAEGARALLQWERDRFDAREGNWPNLQGKPDASGRYACATAWCHGAPGIGLARVACARLLREPALLDEARVALAATRRKLDAELADPGRDAQLCHGVAGLVECAWILEEALGEPGALARARGAGLLLVARHGVEARAAWGEFTEWPTGVVRGVLPTLMTGHAGILLWLLRLHDPTVPSALLPQ